MKKEKEKKEIKFNPANYDHLDEAPLKEAQGDKCLAMMKSGLNGRLSIAHHLNKDVINASGKSPLRTPGRNQKSVPFVILQFTQY